MHVTCINLAIEMAVCRCGHITTAKNPSVEGTSFGLKVLGYMLYYYAHRLTDQNIAEFFAQLHNMKTSRSTVFQARKVIKRILGKQYEEILKFIAESDYVHMDESVIKMNSRQGRIWLATVLGATYIVANPSRGTVVLDAHFPLLRNVPAVCDGYAVYPQFFKDIQRCWIHELRFAEKAAVDKEGIHAVLYKKLEAFYDEIKVLDTATIPEILDLTKRLYGIINSYDKGDPVRNRLERASPHLFTFLTVPGMPPHNNPAELEIRDTVVLHTNVRHKLVTPEGMEIFSVMVSFARTCHNRGLNTWKAFVATAKNPGWNMLNEPMPCIQEYEPVRDRKQSECVPVPVCK